MDDFLSHLGYDPLAFGTALIAIAFTWREMRRNNSVVLKIMQCENGGRQSIDENNGQLFGHLTFLIRNVGISIHNPTVVLDFRDRNGCGWCHHPLKRRSERTGNHDELAKGMIAEFGLKDYELHDTSMILNLEDPIKQDAYLSVYSQGYLAKTFRIGGPRDRIVSKWNKIAYFLNHLLDRRVGKNSGGRDVIKTGRLLPVFITLEFPIKSFVNDIRRQAESGD